jgi:hypothetical protein
MLIQDECAISYFGFADNFSELDLLRKTVEDLIAREERVEVENLARQADSLPEGITGEFWAENHPYWWEHIIAPQFRGAYFIALMSALELHVGRLTNDAGLVAGAPIEHSELKGELYPRIRKYLKLFCNIGNPPEVQWQRILNYYAVRNTLVHNGGHVTDSKLKQTTALSKAVPGLTISNGHVELQAEFCSAAHEDCRRFLFDLWGEIVLLCRRTE